MLGFLKRKEKPEEKVSFFQKLKTGLTKTRRQLGEGLATALMGKKELSPEVLEELEMVLLSADMGMPATQYILQELTKRAARKNLNQSENLTQLLKMVLVDILKPIQAQHSPNTNQQPYVILMVGINGAGKTTTIGKLAKHFQMDGKSVMLAAGDTFRAAAVEQLQTWGERNNIPVIAQSQGSDSASVIYDAIDSAKAKNIDVLIADTAGRLHTQNHLMDELEKIKRVMGKHDIGAPHEVMLVLDGSIGQNALNQAKEFHNAVGVNSLVLTKLDGTAKGGVVFAIARELEIPIGYIGVGEGIDDLQEFDAMDFVNAIVEGNHDSD